ncbi:31d3ff81-e7a4-4f0d-8605-917ffa51f6cd [Sclerotinia trifoliorum]|uniref:31d3ff81-e7a4-4f0d-8605-917ffa51f6cd n=1 Tax=Sclerotinia trifoliorum TaxID=28548 RepID=A0A8H2VM46_9HELO|nr:31d3ff81-e7a4-4f0d-8605-917ffa51f6cd [Sclerotinia trifoliorum]
MPALKMPSMRIFLKNLTPQVFRTSKPFTTNHEVATAAELIPRVENHVKQYMSKFDASHDFAHIKRVVRRAHTIHEEIVADAVRTNQPVPQYDITTITLSALLHDVGDRKYVNLKKENPKTMINTLLLGFGRYRTGREDTDHLFGRFTLRRNERSSSRSKPHRSISRTCHCSRCRPPRFSWSHWCWKGLHIWWRENTKIYARVDRYIRLETAQIAAFDEDGTRQKNGTGSDGTIGAI